MSDSIKLLDIFVIPTIIKPIINKNMKFHYFKLFTSLICTILLSQTMSAKQISIDEAHDFAQKFLSSHNSVASARSMERLTLAHTVKSTADVNKNCLYVFNKGIHDGFVIIAADDCIQTPVLGYSETGDYNAENIPDNFKWWIEQYQREIAYVIENNLTPTAILRNSQSSNVAPLLGQIAWNQGDPYNLLCPTLTNASGNQERTVTGCVATATAQVMRYYKWPAKGNGTHTYTWENGRKTLSMDFSQSTYDWDNMTETYGPNSSTAEKNAVAKLMYDCGISCDMNYNLSANGGSGATSIAQAAGLYNYFDYDRGMKYLYRDYYKLSDWENIVINEIDNKRPVLYSGTGSGGGHAFIIDGYNQDGYFHFNWGWGGTSNGYFVITALNPGELGIGGGAGGYNYNQSMIIGVQPAQTSPTDNTVIYSDGLTVSGDATNGYEITLTRISNRNWVESTFSLGFKIESIETGDYNNLVPESLVDLSLGSLYYYNPITIPSAYFSSQLTDGEYKISLICKSASSNDWGAIPTLLGASEFITMTVKNGVATNVTTDSESSPKLSVSAYELADKLYTNRVATIRTQVKNDGGEYLGDMAVIIADYSGKILASSDLVMAQIPGGETKDVIFDYSMISLFDGVSISSDTPCVLYLFGDASEESIFQIGVLGTATLYYSGDGSPKLAFTQPPLITSAKEDNLSFTLNLVNNGAIFKDAITFYTWDNIDGDYQYCGGISQYAMVEPAETKQLTFSFPYEGIVGHTYLVNIYANNEIIKGVNDYIQYVCSFTLEEGDATGIDEVIPTLETVIENNNNILTVTTEAPIKNINVYSATGLRVVNQNFNATSTSESISLQSQQSGIYMIVIDTLNGTKNSKVYIK